MTINTITKEEYKDLLHIQENHPLLTYQNVDFDNFDKSKMTDGDKKAFEKVSDILKKAIVGFSRFQNYKLSEKDKELKIRFQYSWTADEPNRTTSFTGVGYLYVDELLNGFRSNNK